MMIPKEKVSMSLLPKYKIAHLILAAGSSSRMGTPKQLLPWENTTLIGHAVSESLLLKEVDTYVVLGANYDLIYKEIVDFSITVLNNKDWKSGMGSSIHFGINELQRDKLSYDATLISLADQPLIDKTHFDKLILAFKSNSSAIIASDLGNRIGVPAIFYKSIFNELKALKEDFGARYIIKKHMSNVAIVSASDISTDIDTLEQYEVMIRRESFK